jgi:signal transduction histidine kinase
MGRQSISWHSVVRAVAVVCSIPYVLVVLARPSPGSVGTLLLIAAMVAALWTLPRTVLRSTAVIFAALAALALMWQVGHYSVGIPPFIALAPYALYYAARTLPTRTAVAAGAVAALGSFVSPGRLAFPAPLQSLILHGLVILTALLLGWRARDRQRAHERDIAQAVRESELTSEITRLSERQHIIRELHDVVGHSLALITVRASTAQHLPTAPERDEALRDIESTARTSLTEIRTVLSRLREGPDEMAQSLDALPALAQAVTAAGVPVTLDRAPVPLSAPAQHALYRVAQESLTNVLKHGGPGSTAAVRLESDSAAAHLTVHSEHPSARSAPSEGGSGHEGLRRRLTELGGTIAFDHGPHAYTVRATLPIGDTL